MVKVLLLNEDSTLISKKKFLQEYREGDRVGEIFLVRKKDLLVTKTNKPYLSLLLTDRTGEMDAKAWDQAEELANLFRKNDYVRASGQVTSFNGNLQLKIESLSPVQPEEVDLKDFYPHSRRDLDEMVGELKQVIGEIRQPDLRGLMERLFLEDPEFLDRFKRCPGAKSLHHAYIGGLLEHTLSAAGFARLITQYYPAVDRDLLVAGVLCHDIGKVDELDQATFEYTDEGNLMGHLVMGYRRVAEKISRSDHFPQELEKQLLHLILAHHGELEYGSPKKPVTREAYVLHTIENFDAKMEAFQTLEEKTRLSGNSWSDKAFIFDNQRIYFKKNED